MTLKSDAKFKEKLTCGLKYDMKNLVNFHTTNEKSKEFGWFSCEQSKISKFALSSDPFVQSIRFKWKNTEELWHWRVLQSLKKNWLLVPKATWGVYLILMGAVASPKIYTLMYHFGQ